MVKTNEQDSPAISPSAYQSKQVFLCSLGEISYADFAARTLPIL